MQQICRNDLRSAGSLLMIALWLLILPLRWLLAAVIAAMFHECCHFAAVVLCGGKITGFTAAAGGAVLAADGLSPGRQLICSLAGPLGALLLIPAARWFPLVSVCAVLQSAYNLLPVCPLDGGRALKSAMQLLFSPPIAERITNFFQIFFTTLLALAAIYTALFLHWGIFPLILALSVILRKNSLQTGAITSTISLP